MNKYGIIYGGVQKNIACAGMGIAIIREDLIGNAGAEHADNVGLFVAQRKREHVQHAAVLHVVHFRFSVRQVIEGRWFKRDGKRETKRRRRFCTTRSTRPLAITTARTDLKYRSMMNVPFTLAKGGDVEKQFLKEASDAGFESLKGHRSVGGARASIYKRDAERRRGSVGRFHERLPKQKRLKKYVVEEKCVRVFVFGARERECVCVCVFVFCLCVSNKTY